MYHTGCLNNHINNGEIAKAIIDPKETYFENHVIVAQIAAIEKPTRGFRAIIVPTPEATDFPPVNPRNIERLCPNKTAIAAITGVKP